MPSESSKKVILSKLDVDELLDLIHNEDTPPALRARAIRYLEKNSPR